MEQKNYVYVPVWLIIFGYILIGMLGCCHVAGDDHSCEYEPFIHTCPEDGHGDCPICCDPYKNENQEIIVLDC